MTTSRTERIGSGTNLPWSSCVFVAKARSHAHTLGLVLLFVPAGPTDCRQCETFTAERFLARLCVRGVPNPSQPDVDTDNIVGRNVATPPTIAHPI